jgi:hypothetical protein
MCAQVASQESKPLPYSITSRYDSGGYITSRIEPLGSIVRLKSSMHCRHPSRLRPGAAQAQGYIGYPGLGTRGGEQEAE